MKTINVDEIGKWDSEVSGGKIVFVHVGYDECAEDPTENWDGFGRIYSLSNRHIHSIGVADFYEKVNPMECPGCGNAVNEDFQKYVKFGHEIYYCEYCGRFSAACRVEKETDCVPLGYFEHGLCDWHVSGEIPPGTAGDYRWDGVRVAGLWEPDKYIVKEADDQGLEPGSQERYSWMVKQARQACDTYTKWCNGFVYGFTVEVYKARYHGGYLLDERHDYRYDSPLVEDSCWGFFDTDYMAEEINSAIKSSRTRIKVDLF